MKISKAGVWGVGLFGGLYLITNMWLLYSAKTNSGDSGEGGILLLLFVYPWMWTLPKAPFFPKTVAMAPLFYLSLFINGVVAYFVFKLIGDLWGKISRKDL